MLALVLAMALCLSVCVSVTSRSSIDRNEWASLFFGMEASFDQSYTVFEGNSAVCKNTCFPSRTLSQIPDLENFATAYGSLKRILL